VLQKKINMHVFLCVHMYNRRALELKCLDSADRCTVSQLQRGAGGDEHNSLTARSCAVHVTGLKTVQSSRISSHLSHGATFYTAGSVMPSDGRITCIIFHPFPSPLLALIP